MKKVLNITLGSVVFAMETDGYERLEAYLKSVKERYVMQDDYHEIANDIESAIAEKFIAAKKSEKKAVTLEDVEKVIEEMGSVSEFDESDTSEEASETSEIPSDSGEKRRRLYRNPDDRILGGVASGIAAYFDIDPVIVRLLFFISIFFNGLGVIVYLILWLIVPPATTTSEKYAMRGKEVSVSEITDRVKKKLSEIEPPDLDKAKGSWEKSRGFLNRFFAFLGEIARFIFMVLQVVVGLAFVLVGALGIGVVTAAATAVATGRALFTFDPLGKELLDQLFQNSLEGLFLLIGSAFVFIIPLLFVMIAGSSLLRKRNLFTAGTSTTLFIIWIVSIITIAALGTRHVTGVIDHNLSEPVMRACTAEAKLCPDGSAVGRTGPNCTFPACPGEVVSNDGYPLEAQYRETDVDLITR